MPTTTATKIAFRARWIGAAIPSESRNIRVHSVYAHAVNLQLEGWDLLAAITGPAGEGMPHAMVLGTEVDFSGWRLERGDAGHFGEGSLRLRGSGCQIEVEFLDSGRERHEGMAGVAALGTAFDAAVAALVKEQWIRSCDFQIGALLASEGGYGAMGARLAAAAQSLASALPAVCGPGRIGNDSLPVAVRRLVGLGRGLTPSGDDFLCGFMAAANCHDHGQAVVIGETVEECISATNEISGSLLRCAIRGFFPRDLRHAASAIGVEDESTAVVAIRRLCKMGHSSGADMATGFLFGLFSLIGR